MKKSDLKLGAHVSAAGGLWHAIENGEAMGAQCIQIFGLSPRVWSGNPPSEEEAKKFREAQKKSSIQSVFLHASYLVNLASVKPENLQKSIESLTQHLQIAHMIGAQGLVFHLGSSNGSTREKALDQTVEGMKKVLANVPTPTQLIMENSAGGGEKIGSVAEEIGYLHKKVNDPRVKICLDTAHTIEAGLIERFTPAEVTRLFDELHNAFGVENIVAIHANDSKTAPGSHHDRHENIGEGYIGLSGFQALAAEKRLRDKSWMLEVPGFDGNGPDKKNLDILKGCFE